MGTAAEKQYLVRGYRPSDRAAVRDLCCRTGFLGRPIDPVFEDRELFADYLTGYYTDREPESCFLLECGGKVKGYILGSRHPSRQRRYDLFHHLGLAARGLARYPRYNAASRRFVHWIVTTGWREVPPAPKDAAHFHINLLPEAQGVAPARELITRFLDYLRAAGERQVFGQMVVFDGRRGTRLFERYGFRVLNRSEITKYRALHPEPVYLCTVVKDLRERERL